MRRVAVLLAVIVFAHVSLAGAQTTPTRIRGVIEQVDDRSMTITSREGQTLSIALDEKLSVVAVLPASMADVTRGSFVSIPSLRQGDGSFKAQGVLVFPGTTSVVGQGGHDAWDLEPGSMMTNAVVDAVVTQPAGSRLTLNYGGGEVAVTVPAEAPVVTLGPGNRQLLKKGAAVFVPATRSADGSLTTARVMVGTDGAAPPL